MSDGWYRRMAWAKPQDPIWEEDLIKWEQRSKSRGQRLDIWCGGNESAMSLNRGSLTILRSWVFV